MSLFSVGDKFGVQSANAIRKLWASSTAPSSPEDGEVWLDISTSPYWLKRYNATTSSWEKIMELEQGAGSGLDADLLDGQEGSFYQNASNLNAGTVSRARLGALWRDTTSNLYTYPYIQSGENYGGGTAGTNVTFDYAYSNTPRVIVSAAQNDRLAKAGNISTTGFTFYTTNGDGSSAWLATVDWIAIGQKT